jgi:hypothetical protein
MILDPAELRCITGKKHRDAQRRVLVLLGIEHRVRPDGAILVSRAHCEKSLTGGGATATVHILEPNWSALT